MLVQNTACYSRETAKHKANYLEAFFFVLDTLKLQFYQSTDTGDSF